MSAPEAPARPARAAARKPRVAAIPLPSVGAAATMAALAPAAPVNAVTTPVEGLVSLWARSGFLVRRLHQISVAIFMEEMAELDLTPVQFGAMSIIAMNPGIEQSAVGSELGIDRANNADVLTRLEKSGLIARQTAAHDRRTNCVFLTEPGRVMVLEANTRLARIQKRFLGPLTAAERKAFLSLMDKLIAENNSLGRTVLRLTDR